MLKSGLRGLAMLALPIMSSVAPAQVVAAETNTVGKAVAVVGQAFMLDAKGRTPLARGATLEQGSTIETGPDGYVYIATVDHGFISVRPDSSLGFERYEYDPKQPGKTTIKLVLNKGVVREVSGDGAKAARDRYRLNTPVAALGVRGTDFSVFTDASVTRASVRSGGIVMTPLGDGCTTAGIGPCEGPAAAQLFASERNMLIEVGRDAVRPLLLDAKFARLAPDTATPALRNEDNDARSNTSLSTEGPGVAPAQLNFPVSTPTPAPAPVAQPAAPAPVVTPTAVPAPVITPAAPVSPPPTPAPAPEAQQIFWGRFAPLASLPADTTLAALLAQGSDQAGTILPFAMTRTAQTDMVMPVSGTYAFALKAYEAYFVNATAGTATAATISNATLSVDFGAHTFATQLDLAGGGSSHTMTATGGVANDGKLFSDYTSPATVRGALAGSNATQAGYVFTQSLDQNTRVLGATRWSR